MPRSRNPATYSDVRQTLDHAVAVGGARFRPRNREGRASLGATANWLQRANYLRTLLYEEGSDPYEGWSIQRACPCFGTKCRSPAACEGEWVVIQPATPSGDFIPLSVGDDDLLEEARKVRAEIFGKDDL